jgi:hypothetical protein
MIKSTIDSLLTNLKTALNIKQPKNMGVLPSDLVLLTSNRDGMSVIRATNKVLEAKRKLGLPTGNLEDGTLNSDDILWKTVIEAIMEEITQHAKITTAIVAGQQIVATGGNAGGPVTVYGTTVTNGQGGTVIE